GPVTLTVEGAVLAWGPILSAPPGLGKQRTARSGEADHAWSAVTVGDGKAFVESPTGDPVTPVGPPEETAPHPEHDTASHAAIAAVSDSVHALDEDEPVIEAPKQPNWR